MELSFIFITAGLFLGWSLGANDAANVFGSAVGSRMISFRKAAIICSIFVVLGAVIQGEGASNTLGTLGQVDAIAGAFMVALSAAITVFYMTKLGLPVSTSQAIVGAIVGWNLYTGHTTDWQVMTKVGFSWISSPLLGALFAFLLYRSLRRRLTQTHMHLLKWDQFIRWGLIAAGAFGSFALGANNIANVMGVFVTSIPVDDIHLSGLTISGARQLFFLGSLAIAVGVFTYSKKTMLTVGDQLYKLSSLAALVVVLSNALVLFLFSSKWLEGALLTAGFPPIPLVPVSSSQTIIGAVLGVAIAQGARGIRFRILGEISLGWILTPVLAGILTFFGLFFMDNVFKQKVTNDVKMKNHTLSIVQKKTYICPNKTLDLFK